MTAIQRGLLTSLAQIIIGLAALYWVSASWSAWREGVNRQALWAVSLAIFCLGFAFVNLVFPLIERFLSRPRRGERLALRLPPLFEESISLSLPLVGLVFGATAIPLWMIVFTTSPDTLEQFGAIGLGAFVTFVALIMLAISVRQAYVWFSAQRLQMEIESDQFLPGQSAALFVRGQRGRLPAQNIAIALVCRYQTNVQDGKNSTLHTEILYEELLHEVPAHELAADDWQKQLTLTIPLDAQATIAGKRYPKILWDIQAHVQLSGLPDYRDYFPITVLPLEEEEGEEPETTEYASIS